MLAFGLLAGCNSNNASSGTVQKKQETPKQETQQAKEKESSTSKTTDQTTTPPQTSTVQSNASKPTTVTVPQPSQPNTVPTASHNTEADIAHDVEVIKSKTTLAVSANKGWAPIVNKVPDATVPDGFGGMIYAWNVIMNGDGDGTAQQIYFFDNNRYLGRDTADIHYQSTVHPESTGEINAVYGHFLPNDPTCCPSGQPYTVTYHWNGSTLTPDSIATLNEAVNNQFK